MPKPYFPLEKSERTLEKAMLSFIAVFFLTLLTGLYTQSHDINFDPILVPLLMFSAGLFYLLNGLNTFGKGNLVLKYSLHGLPQLLHYILQKWASLSTEKARAITVITFGSLSLAAAGILFFLGMLSIIKGV